MGLQAQEGGDRAEDKEVSLHQLLLLCKMKCVFLALPSSLRKNVLPLGTYVLGQDYVFGRLPVTRELEIADMLIESFGAPTNDSVPRKEATQRLCKQLARSKGLGV